MEKKRVDITNKSKFGEDLKNARLKLNVSQLSCAKHCGVSIQAYQYWEYGTTAPKIEQFDLICEFLGLDKEDYI